MSKIGFIGLGIMGKPMSKNLLKAGHQLVIFDINENAVAELKQAGAEVGSSPKDVASKTNIIITMLPNSPEVKAVVLGKDGVIEGAQKGSIVVDMSSIAPLVSREVSAALAQKGIRMFRRAGERRPAKGYRWQPFDHGRRDAGGFRRDIAYLQGDGIFGGADRRYRRR